MKLLVEHSHAVCHHAGPEYVKVFLQQRYLIIGVRCALRSVSHRCFACRRFRAENIQPFMAPLPPFRYPSPDALFPFARTGIDLFGPFFIVNGKKLEKHYAIIFNCLVTRACHLESCPFMTSDSFLNAFRRFIARRGQPQLLRSDNGSNFVGARRELQQSLNDSIKNVRENLPESIEMRWDLNPPFAPHFGGVWERMIHTAKRTLLIILGSKKLTLDFFQTILTETELMLNSPPITHVADQPDNEEPLTPNHFLLHRPYANLPPGIFNDTKEPLSFKSWKEVQKVMNHFWDRFLKEYLPTLHQRSKWNQDQHPLQVGDIVWVLKDLTPRGIWPLGRIVSLHPGPDGTTRVCSVRTAYGTFERPAVSFSCFRPVTARSAISNSPLLLSSLQLGGGGACH